MDEQGEEMSDSIRKAISQYAETLQAKVDRGEIPLASDACEDVLAGIAKDLKNIVATSLKERLHECLKRLNRFIWDSTAPMNEIRIMEELSTEIQNVWEDM